MNAPVIQSPGPASVALAERYPEFKPEQIQLIKNQLMDPAATMDEMALFLHQCVRTGLDPMSKQIYAIHRWDSRSNGMKMTIQVGIDGFRAIAQRTLELDGQDGPFWCGDDGAWQDVWVSDEPPVAAKVVVYRKGSTHGFTGVAKWSEFVQTTKQGKVTKMWQQIGTTMLAKVAESAALRKAFPADLSGIYSPEEMSQADKPGVEVVSPPEPVEAEPIVAPADKMPSPDEVERVEAKVKSKFPCEICSKPPAAGDQLAYAKMPDGKHWIAHWDCYSAELDFKTNEIEAEFENVPVEDEAKERVREAVKGQRAERLLEELDGEPAPKKTAAELAAEETKRRVEAAKEQAADDGLPY